MLAVVLLEGMMSQRVGKALESPCERASIKTLVFISNHDTVQVIPIVHLPRNFVEIDVFILPSRNRGHKSALIKTKSCRHST